jgi:hypothetical protein
MKSVLNDLDASKQLIAERALREEAERQRDELRACIDNYDQMTRSAARQASDSDARSSKAERDLTAERARSAALQAEVERMLFSQPAPKV